MRITRRAIIEENRRLKREISEMRAKCRETVNNYAKAVETAEKETEKANARLARAGLEGRYEYTGCGVIGSVRVADYVQVDPVRLTLSGYVPKEIEFARKELAVRIADELIRNPYFIALSGDHEAIIVITERLTVNSRHVIQMQKNIPWNQHAVPIQRIAAYSLRSICFDMLVFRAELRKSQNSAVYEFPIRITGRTCPYIVLRF